MTPDDLKRLAELAAAATAHSDGYVIAGQRVGTWKQADIGIYEDPDLDNDLAFSRGPMLDRQRFPNQQAWREQAKADAAFCYAARSAVPWLLKEVERLREKVSDMRSEAVRDKERLRAALEEACDAWSMWFERFGVEPGGRIDREVRARIAELRKAGSNG